MSTENQPEWEKEFDIGTDVFAAEEDENYSHELYPMFHFISDLLDCYYGDSKKDLRGGKNNFIREESQKMREDIKSFIRSFASQLLDEISLKEEGTYGFSSQDPAGAFWEGQEQAKAELDQQKEAIRKKYNL